MRYLEAMVRHILLLKPKTEATPASIEASRAALAALVGRLPGLLDFCWGVNFAASERRQGYDFGFTMDFVDRQSLAAYAPHPEHQAAAALVRASFENIAVLDFDLK
jgi:Stress responsive A/B Barrel Domain